MYVDGKYLLAYEGGRVRTRLVLCVFTKLYFPERLVDETKEIITSIKESEIDKMKLSIEDKEHTKKQLREWYSATAQGIKDELRAQGRLIVI